MMVFFGKSEYYHFACCCLLSSHRPISLKRWKRKPIRIILLRQRKTNNKQKEEEGNRIFFVPSLHTTAQQSPHKKETEKREQIPSNAFILSVGTIDVASSI
jgi:predicted acetyltransferase